MDFENFSLEIGADGFGLRTQLIDSPVGQAKEAFTLPFDRERLSELPILEVGSALFASLMAGSIRTGFDRSLGHCRSRRNGLRINLRFDLFDSSVAWLCDLPWELLHSGDGFLSLEPDVSIVRFLNLPRSVSSMRCEPPLRVLAVLPEPRGSTLDLESERRRIQSAIVGTGAEVDFLTPPTLERLRRVMQRTRYHVLHFAGHGELSACHPHGSLVFEKDGHLADHVRSEILLDALLEGQMPVLAVLSACNSGSLVRQDADPFHGIASRLVAGGLPAVVAMRTPIGDRAAIAFGRAFYPQLAANQALDRAVSCARRSIRDEVSDSADWAIPTLYLRSAEARLQEAEEHTVAPTATFPPAAPAEHWQIEASVVQRAETISNQGFNFYREHKP